MKKLLPLFFIAVLTSCGTPSVDELVEDRKKLEETFEKCGILKIGTIGTIRYPSYNLNKDGRFAYKSYNPPIYNTTSKECKNAKNAIIKLTNNAKEEKACKGIKSNAYICGLLHLRKEIIIIEKYMKKRLRKDYFLENHSELKTTYNSCRDKLIKNGIITSDMLNKNTQIEKFLRENIDCSASVNAATKLDISHTHMFKKKL